MISEFKGNYRWLSNFPDCLVKFEGKYYRSVEVAYQAAKTLDPAVRELLQGKTSGQAKRIAKDFEVRGDWDSIKIEVMRNLLIQKFNKPHFKELLLATGDEEIVEGNWWGDRFWGVCLKSSEGENNLGKLLMQIREDMNEKDK